MVSIISNENVVLNVGPLNPFHPMSSAVHCKAQRVEHEREDLQNKHVNYKWISLILNQQIRGSPTMGRTGRRRKSEELPGGDIKKTFLVEQEVTKSR